MTTHVAVRYNVTDEAAYRRYRELAGPSVLAYGGIFVTKGRVERHLEEMDDSTNFALIEFPSIETAVTWYESDDYQRARQARKGAGKMAISIIEST